MHLLPHTELAYVVFQIVKTREVDSVNNLPSCTFSLPIFNWVLCLLITQFGFLCIYWILTPYYTVVLQRFFSSCNLSIQSLNNVFNREEFSNFNEVQFINFFLSWIGLLVSHLKLSSPTLFSASLTVLHLAFNSIIHFKLIVKCRTICVLYVDSQLFQHGLLKLLLFSLNFFFHLCQR
jgi:hypothetical protein